ncbi:chitinase-like protein PB1E7.04c [Cocos nucifera]|uniref:Chitinase-like protein PB1E7.04c n=1 Tax=Cocos nucifera TaxID=13894 RepID=A0A8K0IWN1_COCNU|nr:chitinase-like protein PB1E7.04c [Cocos nucifera]
MGSKKKGSISEDDVSILLQRYSATSILALLQEISQFAGPKLDWNALVKRTSTGITNAREYQMLWRHLAYHDKLLDKVEDRSEPLDDDSDLEFELEAFPAASAEALSDATTCAKILISSGSSRESGPINRTNLEAPLTRNLPYNQTPHDPSVKQQLAHTAGGTNAVVPRSLQKQPLATKRSAEVSDGNGSAGSGLRAKRRRQAWTKEEDMELIAAVKKCGEGNWSNILKGDFKHDRTASQLSQRWATIQRRQANLNAGSSNKTVNSTRSEERLAAQKAFSLALDMPMTGNISAILSGSTQSNTPPSSATLSASVSEALPASVPLQASTQATSQKAASNTSNKPRTIPKKPAAPGKPSVGPNPLIQAAAFAAGGRIATPSTAASLFKAAQSRSAVHIRPGGGPSPKSPIMTAKSSPATNMVGSQPPSVRCAQPAVTMPAPAVASSLLSPTVPRHGMQQLQGSSQRTTSNPPTSCAAVPNLSAPPTLSESKPPADPQENAESNSDIAFPVIPAIDVDELLAEEVKDADELELDGAMAQNLQTELSSLDVGENDNNIINNAACGMRQAVAGGMDISKSQTAENQTVNNKAVSPDTGAAENKAMEMDVGGSQIPVEEGNKLASNSQSVNVVGSHTQIVAQEQLAGTEAVVDEVKQSCIQVEQHAVLEDVASGNKSSVDDEAGSIGSKQD